MKRTLVILSVVSVLLAAGASWFIYQTLVASPLRPGAPAQATTQLSVQTVNGETVVVVATDVQRASHIEVAPLTAVAIQPENMAYATVIDLQPLFDLRNRLAAARADYDTLRAQAGNSNAQYERSRVLFDDDRNVSQKSLQDARVLMQADQARLQSANAAQSGLDATMRQQFGEVLTAAAMAPASDLFQRLLAGRAVVLRVTLPATYSSAAPARITIDAPDGQPVAAQKLSASPQGDPAVQGNPYFYVTGRALPVGTHTAAHVPASNGSVSALVIPEAAVIWYGGQPWAYVRTAPDRFTRRYVPASSPGDQGFVVTSGFHAGDEVVMHGPQLLLSQELRPQGIATACKDPPECDD
ncbi:efflux RND transporter periplasmic adaptor subunit [Caballeronia sp. SEWSISQ10-4 2]|uniref:efflux RND transporter periplasmic adaptor subunit n=1 Tax=Caballeronia sp. SEWSISQ10-4 2 TaxID=2937438 RepID=UPI0026525144|nr:efflux RND transporter periplasmic adaptor subunit [Caballeronia sp. SEWSISQ10-4 2]MDN7176851.1 efflux RND transporter periplasmic adaptor subunit [Caballeronia sp. SEWSISQ10-4 2]